MPTVVSSAIEVHLFRRRGRKVEYLLIRRSGDRSLSGVWQPVTGGIEPRETAWKAAAREVLEETGLRPLRWWALEHINVFYKPDRDFVMALPLFAAEVSWTDTVVLSTEHDRYAFVSPAEAKRRVLWASQRRALDAIREEVLAAPAGPHPREITDRIAGLRLDATPTARRAPKRAARKR